MEAATSQQAQAERTVATAAEATTHEAASQAANQGAACAEGEAIWWQDSDSGGDLGSFWGPTNAKECQARCAQHPRCTHFSFNVVDVPGMAPCRLRKFVSERPLTRTQKQGVISGPRACGGAGAASAPHNQTFLVESGEAARAQPAATSGYTAPALAQPSRGVVAEAAGWVLAALGHSCTVACAKQGKICSEESNYRHAIELDTHDKMAALLQKLGGPHCGEFYSQNSGDIPVVKSESGMCFLSTSTRPRSSHDCSAPPRGPDSASKQRLCWCDAACAPNEFPRARLPQISAANASSQQELLTSEQLAYAFAAGRWRGNDKWTLSVRATSNDTVPRHFGVSVGNATLEVEVPAMVQSQTLNAKGAIDTINRTAGESLLDGQHASFRYLGEGTVGNVTFSDFYLSKGACREDGSVLQRNLEEGICPQGGLKSQSRCWYLSRKAANCASTCGEVGLTFSWIVPSAQAPVAPMLLSREGVHLRAEMQMQDPWAAVECLQEDAALLHPASGQRLDWLGGAGPEAWKADECRLSCSCSPCPDGGYWQHNRCWYLSAEGGACSSTCSDRGLGFDLFVPDANEPMVPQLLSLASNQAAPELTKSAGNVRHDAPRGALECFVAGESRFHEATRTGEGANDPAAWSSWPCRMACPCEVPM